MSEHVEVLKRMRDVCNPHMGSEPAALSAALTSAIAALEAGGAEDAFIVPEGAWYAERKGKVLTITPAAQPASQQGADMDGREVRAVSGELMHWCGMPVSVTGTVKTHPSNFKVIDEQMKERK